MNEIARHYARYDESQRLFEGLGSLEFARTQEILLRRLPPPPGVVVDVGGGPGAYALWLASMEYEAHLVEISSKHVEQARSASQAQRLPIASFHVGDARKLPQEDHTADAVLLMGPLYHLVERTDRIQALGEARRALRRGGLLFAAAINRFASLMDGLSRGFIDDERFLPILERDLREGQHRNPTENLDYFTTAFFHHPDELRKEFEEAGLTDVEVLPVEGTGWIASRFKERWSDLAARRRLLDLIKAVEGEPTLLGMSPHLIAIGVKR